MLIPGQFFVQSLRDKKVYLSLHRNKANGALAQVVEQWTENPCVPGSTPGGTT